MKNVIYIIFISAFLMQSCSSTQISKECNSMIDCLPQDIQPEDTGCGGCYPDERGTEICYEYDKQLCEKFEQRYGCIEGKCI